MKKMFCAVLALLILLSAAGCGKADQKSANASAGGYDVDLTKLSSTMVYSEVYNMMIAPDDYVGKTVKMRGNFGVYQDQATDKRYYSCLIADATACCSQGIEFVLDGNYSYPEDYPALDSIITVSGTFDTYEENGYLYCQLVDAKME